MRLFKIMSVIILLIFLSGCSQIIRTESYTSSHFGLRSVCDEELNYYIQKDGIYIADFNFKDRTLLKKEYHVNCISVSSDKLVYSCDGCDSNNKKIQKIKLYNKNNMNKEILSLSFERCFYLYIAQNKIYIFGTPLGSYKTGLYIYDIYSDKAPALITDEKCERISSQQEIYKYEDFDIIWITEKSIGDLPYLSSMFYSKKDQCRINEFIWLRGSNAYLKPVGDDSFVALDKNKIKRIDSNRQEVVLYLPEEERGSGIIYSGFSEIDDHLVLFGQCYKYADHNQVNRPLSEHLYDIVYIIDSEFQIINQFKTTDLKERILFANLNFALILKDNEIYKVYYADPSEYVMLKKINVGKEISTTICGENLLIFSKDNLIDVVNIEE